MFPHVTLGFHGCERSFADGVATGVIPLANWLPSTNSFDWLGKGIYFWEHSESRALAWAKKRYSEPAVIGAEISLVQCLDLLDFGCCKLVRSCFPETQAAFNKMSLKLPQNLGKAHHLDCLVIDDCIRQLATVGHHFTSVRAAYFEGDELFPGSRLGLETHLQVAVRDLACIIRTFRP